MKDPKICVVGLGYVGLPLAVEFAKYYTVAGFDVNKEKIEELKKGMDRTNEVSKKSLLKADLILTADPQDIKESDFIIVAVPTPIDDSKKPDLKYVKGASKFVGQNLRKDAIVVYESTVYPGVTEEICLPILEKESGLKCGTDFKIGYSPERINPGDKEHTVDKIIKIVSGMDEESSEIIAKVYSKAIKAGVFKAKNIKTAEAAKVIENIQRDLNIALVNELSLIFNRMDIDTRDVLEAAGTKWNFHKYTPGLVGGHCIGVDPYYLTFKAAELGYDPKVILAGRSVNEYMAKHVVETIVIELKKAGKKAKDSKVLIMGLTFKENVPDTRNSKVTDIIKYLKENKIEVIAYDPLVDDIEKSFEIPSTNFESMNKVDCVIVFSPHKVFESITLDNLKQKINSNPILFDIKGFYNKEEATKKGFVYKRL